MSLKSYILNTKMNNGALPELDEFGNIILSRFFERVIFRSGYSSTADFTIATDTTSTTTISDLKVGGWTISGDSSTLTIQHDSLTTDDGKIYLDIDNLTTDNDTE